MGGKSDVGVLGLNGRIKSANHMHPTNLAIGHNGHRAIDRECQEASGEPEIKELRAKVGELVFERDYLFEAFGR